MPLSTSRCRWRAAGLRATGAHRALDTRASLFFDHRAPAMASRLGTGRVDRPSAVVRRSSPAFRVGAVWAPSTVGRDVRCPGDVLSDHEQRVADAGAGAMRRGGVATLNWGVAGLQRPPLQSSGPESADSGPESIERLIQCPHPVQGLSDNSRGAGVHAGYGTGLITDEPWTISSSTASSRWSTTSAEIAAIRLGGRDRAHTPGRRPGRGRAIRASRATAPRAS